MGQFNDKIRNVTLTENRVLYDEICNNGLMIKNKYVPEELLSVIFCHIDYKTLLKCQLVCKHWKILIQSYIWRKKAEMITGHALPVDENAPWTMYYLICAKQPFYKNLIKNSSIDTRFQVDWKIINCGGDGWKVESPPLGAPALPEDSILDGKNSCFVTSYNKCLKYQVINLVEEGFSEYLLDNLQPVIKISEYFCCRWDCPAVYRCTIELLTKTLFDDEVVFDSYNYSKVLENGDQNTWFKFEHEFKNYGTGLRKIKFIHGGQDRRYWAGHYGSKMAGACIKLEIPEFHQSIH